MMKCPDCGFRLRSNASYCGKCGKNMLPPKFRCSESRIVWAVIFIMFFIAGFFNFEMVDLFRRILWIIGFIFALGALIKPGKVWIQIGMAVIVIYITAGYLYKKAPVHSLDFSKCDSLVFFEADKDKKIIVSQTKDIEEFKEFFEKGHYGILTKAWSAPRFEIGDNRMTHVYYAYAGKVGRASCCTEQEVFIPEKEGLEEYVDMLIKKYK